MDAQNILTIEKLREYGSAYCPVNSSDELDGFCEYVRTRDTRVHVYNLSQITVTAHTGGHTLNWFGAFEEHRKCLKLYRCEPTKTVNIYVGSTEEMPIFAIEAIRSLGENYGMCVFHTELAGLQAEGNSPHYYVRKHGLRFRVVDSLAQLKPKTEVETSNLP